MYGALIQLAGMGYNAEMQGRATHKALTKNRKVRAADEQYSGYAQDETDQTANYLRGLSLARLKNQGLLASNISGQPMQDAGQAGQDFYGQQLGGVLDRGQGAQVGAAQGVNRGSPAGNLWRARADARSAPRLGSQADLVMQAGRRQGIDRYRQDQMNGLAEANINLDRKTGERFRRVSLNDAYRQRKLAEIMRTNGVDSGEANMRAQGELIQGVAGVGGAALNSYQANQPADPYNRTPVAGSGGY